MKIKNSSKLIFIITLCLQIFVFTFVLTKNVFLKQDAIKHNRIYSFDCTYYDPYNFLKGRYVQLTIGQERVLYSDLDAESFTEGDVDNLIENEKVYLLIKPDEHGMWHVCGVRKNKPKEGAFIRAKFKTSFGYDKKEGRFNFSVDEYYMQENFAAYVDKMRTFTNNPIHLEVYCDKNGNLLQKQLYVKDGEVYKPIEDYIKSKIEK